MSRNDKSSVSSLQNEQHKRILSGLLREEGNRRCADCLSRGPTWASVNLGVFMCLNCSGIHRSLGVHNSKVRSTNLDTWLPEQVAFVQAMGNARGALYWEATLPRDFRRPAEADMAALRVFITDKYVHRRYAAREWAEPPSIENFETHPFLVGAAGAQQAQQAQQAAAEPVGVSDVKPAATAPPPAAHFDLLSLDDDPTPAVPAAPAAVVATASVSTTSGVPAAADWDPFSDIARPAPTTTAAAPAPPPPSAPAALIDPFAEISMDRTPSYMSMTSSAAAPAPPAVPAVVDPFALPSSPAQPAALVDPFALPSLPPPKAPSSISIAPSASAASMASGAGTGRAPMRVPSAGAHSKGSLSHDDILAMFDKPGPPRPASAAQQQPSAFNSF